MNFSDKEDISIKLKIYTSLFIFLFVNALFSIKYVGRYTDWYIPFSMLIVGFLCCVLFSHKYLTSFTLKHIVYLSYLLPFAYVVLSLLIINRVDVETLNVDRWSVITSFWQSFEKEQYVYFAQSNVGNPPGPMPFYFILAYPFYKLGELGWYSMLGFPLFIALLKYFKVQYYILFIAVLALVLSPFIWWEVLCRSNVFLNASLVLFSIMYFLKDGAISTKRLLVSGILFGLLLSTRSIFSIAFIIVFIYALKSHYISPKQVIMLGFVSFLSFVLTFLPFVIGYEQEFITMNPFFVQSTFLMPFAYTVFFIALAFVFGWFCNQHSDVYFYTSLNLFLCIFVYFLYQVSIIGLYEATFGWIADISYFIFATPFALFYYVTMFNKSNTK